MAPPTIPLADRLKRWTVQSENCWEYLGGRDKDGYGKISMPGRRGKPAMAHRVAYEIAFGPIPKGLQIDHLCRNKACVNPSHLEAVSSKVNTLRGIGPSAKNQSKTHCKRGHPFDERHTQVIHRKDNIERHCRECKRLWMADHRASLKALKPQGAC